MLDYRAIISLFGAFCVSFASAAVVDSTLVYHCRFDSPRDITNPTIGEAGEILGTIQFAEGLRGQAARIPEYGKGFVCINLPKGLPLEKGKVSFYAKLETERDYFVSAGNPTFIHICPPGSAAEVNNFAFTANNGGGKSGFLLNFAGYIMTTSDRCYGRMPYSLVFGEADPKAWHRYSYVWNTKGLEGSSDTVRAYIDDQLMLKGTLPERVMEKYVARMSQVLTMCLPRSPKDPMNNHVPFLIDELKVWSTDYPVGEEDLLAKDRKPKKAKTVIRLKDGPELIAKKRAAQAAAEAEARRAAEAAKTLAPWATGSFYGGGETSSVAFTVDEKGVVAGELKTVDGSWNLAAGGFLRNDLTNSVCEIVIEMSDGEKKETLPIKITPDGAKTELFEAWMCEWTTAPEWQKVAARFAGKTARITEEDRVLQLNVKDNAEVEVLMAVNGAIKESKSTLVPVFGSETEYRVFVCFPKTGKDKGFAAEYTFDIDSL